MGENHTIAAWIHLVLQASLPEIERVVSMAAYLRVSLALCYRAVRCTACASFFAMALLSSKVSAQQVVTTPDGQTMVIQNGASFSPGAVQRGRPAPNQATPSKPNGNPQPGKPGEKKPDAKKPGKPGDGEESGEMKNVTRQSEPPAPPDPSELDVSLQDGMIEFQFRNQPWPDVLRWYASVSRLSLDWQELPGDYINLATQRPHTLEETGDMLNRALLMRGFTMLKQDEALLVSKVEAVNPSLVPRVKPSELANLPPHTFVRASFTLSFLLAEEVHEEFGSMLSKNGKLTPLMSTNRLEAMDAAANLRDINDILEQEQSTVALENLAREFVLEHARASSIKEQLEVFLGISSGGGGASSSPMSSSSQARAMQQMQQKMQQQMQAAMKAKGGAATSKKRSDDVYLVANDRSNSIIVHAQPNKMAVISAFIKRVDVRNGNAADYQRLQTRMKVFRLASLGPSQLVNSLTEMDVLEPATRLQVDEENNAIIAYASIADQYLIQQVIERLDGSERSFEVIQLRRLDAESVAGSIKFLMGADDEEDNNSSSRRSYYSYGYYNPYGSNSSKKEDKMRVGANVQDNQVLLWANAIEMEEVQNLLIKLGELPPEGGRPSTVRVIDASRQPETFEYLQRLKEEWERISPNSLEIPGESEFQPKQLESETDETASEKESAGADVDEKVTRKSDPQPASGA